MNPLTVSYLTAMKSGSNYDWEHNSAWLSINFSLSLSVCSLLLIIYRLKFHVRPLLPNLTWRGQLTSI